MFPAYAPDPYSELPLTAKEAKGTANGARKPKLNIKHTLMKWFIDCMTLGALLNTVGFLVIMGLLKSQPWEQITKNIRQETLPIVLNSYKIWPVASIINFAFVPVEKRIVFLSCVGEQSLLQRHTPAS